MTQTISVTGSHQATEPTEPVWPKLAEESRSPSWQVILPGRISPPSLP
eukprot:COSAG04_NODE_3423_length_2824_cov_2.216514_2_plen_48_part_00